MLPEVSPGRPIWRIAIRVAASLLVGGGWYRCLADDAADRYFLDRVQPLIESRCVSCHNADKQKGGLRLDSRAAVLKGGDGGPSIVPGHPEKSLLLHAVLHTKDELKMPPKEKLSPKDIAVLEKWVADGAPWPVAAASTAVGATNGVRLGDAWTDPRNPIVRLFGGQRLDLWSFKPIRRPEPPAVRDHAWGRNSIDRFILARLEKEGLRPSPEATRRALIRRLYFDLIGLPPRPQDVAAFENDRRIDAYERLVDRLLDSPRYGEHWGRQWLDVVRYSDSNGFDWDEFRPRAWRFRDYVIRSFNADKPFDRFIREQLAGDELLSGPPTREAEQDCLIATGYLRMGPQDNSAPLFNEQARARAELMSDLVEMTGSAFLGMTLGCCRCHDHKYDPLAQADHYRFRAFFEPVKYADDRPLDLASEQEAIRRHNEQVAERTAEIEKLREHLLAGAKKRLRNEKAERLSKEDRDLLAKPEKGLAASEKEKHDKLKKSVEISDDEARKTLDAETGARVDDLASQLSGLKSDKRAFALGLLMSDGEETIPATHVLFQGDYKQERGEVVPGFLSALDPNPAAIEHGANPKTSGRRLTLADWIASPKNPLTARVLVNRLWQGHFGRGLVATPNDFGLAGARPTHPELLDWLASELIRDGWSMKSIHRLIVTSAAYRQASTPAAEESLTLEGKNITLAPVGESSSPPLPKGAAIDVENTLLWRQNARRLSAEQLRDALMAVSGSLLNKSGGSPVWPELPSEILQANPAFLDDNETKTKGWYPSPLAERNVRSVFLVQKKTVRVPFMETFDLPENSTSCPRRNVSTVAPQALSLLNSPLAIEAAKALAKRVASESPSTPESQVDRAFSLALQRRPDPEERAACVRLLQRRNLQELCRALLNLNEFVYVD